MNFYQFVIPRLNGKEIERDFDYYHDLVKKGIAGFIIFGGKLETVRCGIKWLQKAADRPLIIASDLEQGLGQQIEGGTLFPPAMAVASAIKKRSVLSVQRSALNLLRKTFKAIAQEARYAGINTIFAPVLDINTNPKNPIIATRAFGEDLETVSFFGCEMIKAFQSQGIAACAKHFPGHGDTEIDSHIKLPIISKGIKSLEKTELAPFRDAVKKGVKIIMLGHLKVPAMDSSGIPVSLSARAVKYLRNKMGFKGIIITDALNMGGIGKYSEEEASLTALKAGVDLLLHPTNPHEVALYLERSKVKLRSRDSKLRTKINTSYFSLPRSEFKKHRKLSEELTKKAVKIQGQIKEIKKPLLIILNDEDTPFSVSLPQEGSAMWKGKVFAESLKEKFPDLKVQILNSDSELKRVTFPSNVFVIVGVFSKIKAWKGGASRWLLKSMKTLEEKAEVFVSFGSPYLLDVIKKDCVKINAYWDSDSAQHAVAELF